MIVWTPLCDREAWYLWRTIKRVVVCLLGHKPYLSMTRVPNTGSNLQLPAHLGVVTYITKILSTATQSISEKKKPAVKWHVWVSGDFSITVKHLFFVWPYFREATILSIFPRLTFANCPLLFYNPYMISYWQGFYFRYNGLANLRQNKVLANKRCFTVHMSWIVDTVQTDRCTHFIWL